jgi:hypothetical protein
LTPFDPANGAAPILLLHLADLAGDALRFLLGFLAVVTLALQGLLDPLLDFALLEALLFQLLNLTLVEACLPQLLFDLLFLAELLAKPLLAKPLVLALIKPLVLALIKPLVLALIKPLILALETLLLIEGVPFLPALLFPPLLLLPALLIPLFKSLLRIEPLLLLHLADLLRDLLSFLSSMLLVLPH